MEERFLCPVYKQAQFFPDRIAIAPFSITYSKFHDYISMMVVSLLEKGITANQRIGIVSPNTVEFIVLLWALFRIKAVGVLFSTRNTIEQIVLLSDSVGCSLLFCSKYCFPLQKKIPWLILEDYIDFSKKHDSKSKPIYMDVHQEGTILFTSGTTSLGKAVLHTYGNHWYSAIGSNKHIPLSPDDKWLVSLPLYHVGGLGILFRCFSAGATIVFSPLQDIGGIVERYGITHLSLVPTQLRRIRRDSHDFQSLKCILLGGDCIPPSLIQEYFPYFPLYTTYGSTEMASQVATSRKGETCLHSLCYREITLGDDQEILVRGKTLCKGYIRERNVVALTDNHGWFHTRDRGYIDDQGCLHILGRKDTMFISGGENIYPEEIENLLLSLQNILRAIVVPVEDKEFGYRPVAFIVLKEGVEDFQPSSIQHDLERHLPRFKIPKVFLPWPSEIPVDITDKKSRKLLVKYVSHIKINQHTSHIYRKSS